MRRSPTLIAFVFISLTLSRVADYVDVQFHAGFWSWFFSIGLALAILISSYNTRKTVKEEKTMNRNRRRASWVSLGFFVLADGYFNLAEVLRVKGIEIIGLSSAGPWIYGVFPTVAAVLMGVLQGYLDREQNVKEWSLKRFVSGMKASRAGGSLAVQALEAVMQAGQGELPEDVPAAQPGKPKKKTGSKKPVPDEDLLAVWQQDPNASDEQVASKVGITRSAVQQRRTTLQDRGVIINTEQGVVIYEIPSDAEKK